MHKIIPIALRLNVCALLTAAVLVLPQSGAAQAELFPSTEVTARPDVAGWLRYFTWPTLKTSSKTEQLDIASLAAIEPASGAAAPMEDHADKDAGHGASDDGHGTPAATGKSEGQKSFTGKVVGAPPPLPVVTIGGQAIISKAQSLANDVSDTTPKDLKTPAMQDYLSRRFQITAYAHSPRKGPVNSRIQVIQFVDFSCGQCMPELAKIDNVLRSSSETVLLTYVHAPTAHFQDTNMPAFYGKVASRAGVFWQYRDNLIQRNPTDSQAIFNELLNSGVSVRDARGLMLNEARRFYRELDADALLARAFGVSQPPVLFVNGIRVGEQGLPLDRLQDVLNFVNARIQRGLPEPPK